MRFMAQALMGSLRLKSSIFVQSVGTHAPFWNPRKNRGRKNNGLPAKHPQPRPGTQRRAGALKPGRIMQLGMHKMDSTLSEKFLFRAQVNDACIEAQNMVDIAREYANNALRVAEKAVIAVQKAEARLAKCKADKADFENL